ncbi:MAG: ATP-dependent helicase [Ignavibacteriales bacterium]|nr:ATP-dependent helicase [Ignavibacteriales bacterium]
MYSNLIVYYKFFSNSNLLFLYQTVNTNTGERIDKQEFEKICSSANTTEDILRVSFRSYPEYVLCDNDIWLEIQNESEGNLALSTEEAKIFNSIIHNKYEEPLFPLFINGRAGSGKSTLLYYTFAHILLNHIIQTKKLNTPPLFLTYSSKLLATASTSIKKILKTNVKIRTKLSSEKVNYVDSYLNSSDYNKSFKTFRGFQKELLSSIKKEQFEDQNYYSFSKFKEDWNKYCKTNPSKYVRGITSEFAWYVIRTFIKGILNSGEEFLEPDDYKTLPRELKTVEQDTYEKIYESVFDSWYKNHLRDIHFWDDQDLTKTVLENIDKLKLEYPAVFCDEAQDFSNIELELISELSLFSKRKIEFRDIKRIPLAFAGDPLQTINPTGFKWETIQANFYEKVQNDFGRYGKIPLNFKELNNNYRSNKPIVIFNNIIQLIRTLLFDLKNISPQKSWFTTEYSINPTLKINDLSIIEEALMEEGKTRTIIIPCEEDQEKDYIQNRDSFLKEKAIANDEVVQNIWGPMNVKGLEYNTVIVYNFGDYLANSLSINLKDLIGSLLASDNFQINLTESKRIELEYFLNKLYVATSRAKKNLVIVDTDMGNKFLWSVFNDFIKQLPIKYSIENNDYTTNWDEDNEISEFQFSSEVLDLADDKPEDLADQYYKDGLNSSNPRKLRTAAEYFKASKKPTEANRALAKALELENNYLKAAEYYEKIQDGDKAIQCLWKSNDANRYNKILSVYENLPKNPNNIFYLASEFVLSDNKKNNSILFLRYFASLIRDSENLDFYMLAHKSWENIYNEMLIALELYSRDTATLSDWDEAIKILKSLSEKGIQLKNKPEYMTLLFNLKQYKDIIEELTAANDLESELYLKSSAYSTSYPKNLEYYYKLKEFKIISDLYLLNEKEADNLNKTQKKLFLVL